MIRGLAVSGICSGFAILGNSPGFCGRWVYGVGIVPMPA